MRFKLKLEFFFLLPGEIWKRTWDYWNKDIVRTSVANQKLNIQGEHPAPFPNEIIIRPILQTSKEGELILLPFMGSGTVGRVCDELKEASCFTDFLIY